MEEFQMGRQKIYKEAVRTFTVSMTQSFLTSVEEAAKLEKLNRSAFIRQAIKFYLDNTKGDGEN